MDSGSIETSLGRSQGITTAKVKQAWPIQSSDRGILVWRIDEVVTRLL